MSKRVRVVQDLPIDTKSQVMSVGRVIYDTKGRLVYVTGGSYMGMHGVSNFFYWAPINEDGSLGKEEHGYGWSPAQSAKLFA